MFSFAACSSNGDPAIVALVVDSEVNAGAVPGVTGGVKANGSNIVTITVDGATLGPIRLTTSRGIFENGETTMLIPGTSGSVGLVVCDARTENQCVGAVTVSAFDAKQAFGQTKLMFVGIESSCVNHKDDNADKRTDCADPDCDEEACLDTAGVAGTCHDGGCVLPICIPTNTIEVCSNEVDDDCDRKVDCEQTSCGGQACRSGSPTFICKNAVCTDVGAGIVLTVTPKRPRIPADGIAQTTVALNVTKLTIGQPTTAVEVTTDLGAFVVEGQPVTSATVSTGPDGSATVVYQGSDTAGTATISARIRDLPQIGATGFVTMPALSSISISSIQTNVMGVKYSGWNEQNQISVVLLDTQQQPYPDGLAVHFEHQQLVGSVISTPAAEDTESCAHRSGCLGYDAPTASPVATPDTLGIAAVNLYSGTASGPVSVTATATAGGVTRNITVGNMAIVGAKASGSHISISCVQKNVPGFVDHDCTNAFNVVPPISCTAFLADRFNNVLGVATRADFRSEAGSPGPPILTAAYDPVAGGDQTAMLGFATNSVAVTGHRIPVDVDPVVGEFSESYDSGCGVKVHNPRDGLSTVIAAAQGEEGFVDLNGDGVYNPGEPFIDAGEPFVDENDNGFQDGDERFIDVNQNGSWDKPNGNWDSNTVVWAETRVLYSSGARISLAAQNLASRYHDPAQTGLLPSTTTDLSPFTVSAGMPRSIGVLFSDQNFNPLAEIATFTIAPLASPARVSALYVPQSSVDRLGMAFTQQFCDQAPPEASTTCRATCQFSPCYRVTRLADFQYGTKLVAVITPTSPGNDIVEATAVTGTSIQKIRIDVVSQ